MTIRMNLAPSCLKALEMLRSGGQLHVIDYGTKGQGREAKITLPNKKVQLIRWDAYTALHSAGLLKMTGGGRTEASYVISDGA